MEKSEGFTPIKSIHSFHLSSSSSHVECGYWYWLLRGRRLRHLPASWVQTEDRDSQRAAGAGADKPHHTNCSPLLRGKPLFTLNVCWFLFCLAFIQSFDCPPFIPSSHSGLSSRYSVRFPFNSVDILESQTKKERFQGEKKRGYFFLPSSLSGTHPCFLSQRKAESQSWPDRQQGWFHVTGTGAKGPESYSLHFLLVAHCSTVVCSPDRRRQKRRLPARVSLHPEDPPAPASNIYQSRQNPFEFRAVLRVWPGQTESGAGPERSLYFLWCWFANSLFSSRRSAMNGQRQEVEAGH